MSGKNQIKTRRRHTASFYSLFEYEKNARQALVGNADHLISLAVRLDHLEATAGSLKHLKRGHRFERFNEPCQPFIV